MCIPESGSQSRVRSLLSRVSMWLAHVWRVRRVAPPLRVQWLFWSRVFLLSPHAALYGFLVAQRYIYFLSIWPS